jgi:hypothetical protein
MDDPVARRHLAILQLTDQLPHDQVYEMVADPDTATEQAFRALDQADIPFLRGILDACDEPLTGMTGAFFAAVVTAADGDTGQARQLALEIAQHGTDIQRRAYAIRLRALAHELADAEELANLVDPDASS